MKPAHNAASDAAWLAEPGPQHGALTSIRVCSFMGDVAHFLACVQAGLPLCAEPVVRKLAAWVGVASVKLAKYPSQGSKQQKSEVWRLCKQVRSTSWNALLSYLILTFPQCLQSACWLGRRRGGAAARGRCCLRAMPLDGPRGLCPPSPFDAALQRVLRGHRVPT